MIKYVLDAVPGAEQMAVNETSHPRCYKAYILENKRKEKGNSFESVLMRWMKLEPIIQSEVSQKEKHQYSILTHIYGI